MIKVVGLTGGIGSGKSTIARFFEDLGVSVYYSDIAAKKLMEQDTDIYNAIERLFGSSVCSNGCINRELLASIVFSNKKKLKLLNSILHTKVKKDFESWLKGISGKYVVKETAILFESGAYKDCDAIITVIAPIEERIRRLKLQRGMSKGDILKRIDNQWSDEDRIKLSDYVVENIHFQKSKKKLVQINHDLLNKFYYV